MCLSAESRLRAGLDRGLLTGHTCPMKQILARLALFTVTAAVAAIWLAYVFHNELGLPRHAVRSDALLSAALAGGLLIIGLYSHRLGRRK
jgi:hypothetical protein